MNRGQLKSSLRAAAVVGLLVLLAACARQIPEGVAHDAQTPGFWWGLWHGFIFPWSWIGSLFQPTVAVYAVPVVRPSSRAATRATAARSRSGRPR